MYVCMSMRLGSLREINFNSCIYQVFILKWVLKIFLVTQIWWVWILLDKNLFNWRVFCTFSTFIRYVMIKTLMNRLSSIEIFIYFDGLFTFKTSSIQCLTGVLTLKTHFTPPPSNKSLIKLEPPPPLSPPYLTQPDWFSQPGAMWLVNLCVHFKLDLWHLKRPFSDLLGLWMGGGGGTGHLKCGALLSLHYTWIDKLCHRLLCKPHKSLFFFEGSN